MFSTFNTFAQECRHAQQVCAKRTGNSGHGVTLGRGRCKCHVAWAHVSGSKGVDAHDTCMGMEIRIQAKVSRNKTCHVCNHLFAPGHAKWDEANEVL